MNADKMCLAAIAALLLAVPLHAQDLNSGSLLSSFKDRLQQTSVAAPASAAQASAAPAAKPQLEAVPVGRPVADKIKGDRIDTFSLVSLRQLQQMAKDPEGNCGWSNGGDGMPTPCPTVFHPVLEDGDQLGVEYTDCDRNTGGEITTDGCGSSHLFTLPGLTAKGGKVYLNGEVVAQVKKGLFTTRLKLVNGYHFTTAKAPSVEPRSRTEEECVYPSNSIEPSPCVYTGRTLGTWTENVAVNTIQVYLTK